MNEPTATASATQPDRIRRLEADNADLRRDFAELAALDPDGLRAKVVALHAEVAEREMHLGQLRASLAAECDRSAEFYRRATVAEMAVNPMWVQHDMDMLRKDRDAFSAHLRLALADVERLTGAPGAEVLMQRRGEVRDLTDRLNDALAAREASESDLARWKRSTTFTIDPPQDEAEAAFKADHDARHAGENEGAIGGRYTYAFCVTSIGPIVTLRCACGGFVDLTGDL